MANYISRYPFNAGKGPYKLGQGVMYPVNQNPKPPARAFDPRVEKLLWKRSGMEGQASLYDLGIRGTKMPPLAPSFMNTFGAAQNIPLIRGQRMMGVQSGGRKRKIGGKRKVTRGYGFRSHHKKGFEFSGGFE